MEVQCLFRCWLAYAGHRPWLVADYQGLEELLDWHQALGFFSFDWGSRERLKPCAMNSTIEFQAVLKSGATVFSP